MTTLHPPEPQTSAAGEPRTSPSAHPTPWRSLVVALAVVVAANDLAYFALIAEVIPPLALGVVLAGVGLALLRRRPRAGLLVLGLSTLLMLVGNAPFALDHLTHPGSPIDFVHAVVGSVGRVLVLAAVVGCWRRGSDSAARRLRVTAVGLAAAMLSVTTVAALLSTSEDAVAGDVEVVVEAGAFPETVRVASGDTLFVDNRDVFRHTFTVREIGLDLELAANGAARGIVDAAPGSYEVTCEVPGHGFMNGTLEVG